ncbi:PolC-type DNA polymerase III [Anaerotignum lactatifermentans]|uniref:DNA polymerase III PolC-type n=2 Tax=Anaerotignum lactatifermentans TaxID=160404 RepID=A0A1M6LT39_9FIRM|nr:PolC-type DNA polymerase III [Anaerotignum lactatifermentans]SHJ74381.1 DNA polymerase-3 subunit alpha [[Clostridium] lactatifermentans DSM 14214] [Anaerotignum lactatifermentans DSM 14214]
MTAKKFPLVFDKVSLSAPLQEVFRETTVLSLTIHRKEREIVTEIAADAVIPPLYWEKLRKEMMQQLPGVKEVHIFPKYQLMDKEPKAVLADFWDTIRSHVAAQSKVCSGVISDADWDYQDGKMQIFVKHNMAYYLSQKKLDDAVAKLVQEETGLAMSVQFKNVQSSEEDRARMEQEQRTKTEELLQQIASATQAAEQAKVSAEVGAVSEAVSRGILFGKEFTGTPVKIVDTKIPGESVIVEGNIFNIEPREIKGEKYIVSFDITDKSDSTTVKFFVKRSVFDNELKDKIKKDAYLRVQGEVQFDKYAKEINIMAKAIMTAQAPPPRMDTAEEKRVELHLHTQMSSMDGVTPVKTYIKRAIEWGHKAIAITDHGVVQAFPDAMNAADKSDLKVIYGVEAYLIDDLGNAVFSPRGQNLDDTYVVFDIETTGLSKEKEMITEIGAVKVADGKIIDRFSTFVNPQRPISAEITKLTGITDDMVKDAPTIENILPEFLKFCEDTVLVAHNASFDTGFIRIAAERAGLGELHHTIVDTLELARALLPELNKHKLDIVCEHLGVTLNGHHRAVNDAEATAEVFIKFLDMLAEKKIFTLDEINVLASRTVNYKKLRAYHAIILVKNYTGLRNLYELVSMAHIDYFFRRPRIPKSKFMQMREGLILGSACEAGELYRALLDGEPKQRIEELVHFYDYLEIQPLGNNKFMIDSPRVENIHSMEDIKNMNRKIVELGETYGKPVVATCDVHFIDPDDAAYRKIIMAAEGFPDADNQPPLYFRTTDEMLAEFDYLGEEKAREVVITNTNLIADQIEKIKPIPDETFPPKIEGADEQLRQICMDKAHSIYGDPLPPLVQERLETELNSIISNGYAVLYIIAQKLVWKSVADGYLVGSRGSVGSSFAANMAGITEVNSLPPHYVCPNCKYSDFDSDLVKSYAMEEASGCDMPDMNCPKCGTLMHKDGHDIPFQTFLGFEGDKEPDIDLNFSGEYQQTAHAYTEELFGVGHVFKAGTIGTLADKTAYGFVKKYFDEREITAHNAEITRLMNGCTGVKRTTGQHPGGLMVVPSDHNIYEFCPIQRPANDVNSTVTTTHFDYHSISGRLLKLDLLGHDDPTVIRMLYDLTGVNPQTVPLGDPATMSLFESPAALGVTAEDIGCETGTLGIPEFGTKFVRGMLLDTKPKTFADLLRISGLSHGTDVWLGNAQTLIENGTITLKETISTRDSIMIYLINKGVDKKKSFKIMEKVRKGKGLTDEDIADMKAADVPDWYIESCQKIKYMFPKAHAAAYVMMAFRIAYFKINYPEAYYATYFTVRACDDFDYSCMCKGMDVAKAAMREIHAKGMEATAKDKAKMTVLELIVEFYARGFKFLPIDLYKSDSRKFIVTEEGLIPPFNSLQGLGTNAAQSIVDGRAAGEFHTIEELKERTSLGRSLIDLLKENGVLNGIPETNQLSLF